MKRINKYFLVFALGYSVFLSANEQPLHFAIKNHEFDLAKELLILYPEQAQEAASFPDQPLYFDQGVSTIRESDTVFSYSLRKNGRLFVENAKIDLNLIEVIDATALRGPNLLELAIENNAVELVEQLLEMGSDPNSCYLTFNSMISRNGMHLIRHIDVKLEMVTPLYKAIMVNNAHIVDLLLKAGANPEKTTKKLEGFYEVNSESDYHPGFGMHGLSSQKASLKSKLGEKWIPAIQIAAMQNDNDEILRVLIRHQEKEAVEDLSQELVDQERDIALSINNSLGWPALLYAIETNKVNAVKEIIQRYPEQLESCVPSSGFSIDSWHNPKDYGSNWVRNLFYSNPVDISYQPPTHCRGDALQLAVKHNSLELAELLLELGVNPNLHYLHFSEKHAYQDSPIGGHRGKEVLLLQHVTPLWLAFSNKNDEMIELLLKYGADPKMGLRKSVSHGWIEEGPGKYIWKISDWEPVQ